MVMRIVRLALLSAAIACALPGAAAGQQISVDRGVRAAGLWCFPLATEPHTYVYLPAAAGLATDEGGKPQFSLVRYVTSETATGKEGAGISAAGGGAVLHFLVTIETPEATVTAAQAALRDMVKDDKATLRGPLVFQDGRYALVSSILNPASGSAERKLLATGRAPVLEGNRLAFSFDLAPQESTLLLRSFEMRTPDVSLVFDMTFAGLSEAYDADLTIDWAEARKTNAFRAGGSVYFVSADVELAFDEMRRNNAIKLRSSGNDASMEALLTTVYSKLLELMFRPVEPERVPAAQAGGLADALTALAKPGGPLSSRKLTGFGINVGYQLKDMRSSGTSVLNFNHRALVERHSTIAFNIGDLYQRYGSDQGYFRTVNLDDPAFRQREIAVGLDGALVKEFERYINAVTLTLRKQHQNGEETVREVVLDRQAIARQTTGPRLVYGWRGDENQADWLQYDFRTRWSFVGGGSYQTEWTRADRAMIDLFAPYERRAVQIVGDREALRKQRVRAVIVEVEYPFFGDRRRQQVVLRPEQEGEDPRVEITLPLGQFEYDYVITWQLEGNRRLTSRGRDAAAVLFVDELPPGPSFLEES